MRLTRVATLWVVFLSGCANSVYFYETEKFTLATLEGRPDPSQPVQLSVGFKQRVVVVSPPTTTAGDAASTLGKFYLDRRPEQTTSPTTAGGVTIKTSLFTGEAATGLSPEQKANVLKGLAISEWSDLAASKLRFAAANGTMTELNEVAQSEFGQVDSAKLKKATGLESENYTLTLHQAIRKKLGVEK